MTLRVKFPNFIITRSSSLPPLLHIPIFSTQRRSRSRNLEFLIARSLYSWKKRKQRKEKQAKEETIFSKITVERPPYSKFSRFLQHPGTKTPRRHPPPFSSAALERASTPSLLKRATFSWSMRLLLLFSLPRLPSPLSSSRGLRAVTLLYPPHLLYVSSGAALFDSPPRVRTRRTVPRKRGHGPRGLQRLTREIEIIEQSQRVDDDIYVLERK